MIGRFSISFLVVLMGMTMPLLLRASANDSVRIDYVPEVSGILRMGYEYSTVEDVGRFAVSNARVKLDGKVTPWAGYRLQVDFCNNGSMKVVDAYAKLTPLEKLDLYIGQERVPFSVDASRDLKDYIFTDLSFGAQYLGNVRSVGAKAGYRFLRNRIYVEGGVFNNTPVDSKPEWSNSFTYSVKMNLATSFGLTPQICFMSRRPKDGIRYNVADLSLSWRYRRLFVEGEYIYCNYDGSAYQDAHTYNFIVDYGFDIDRRFLSKLSIRGRFDGMTDISTGVYDDSGKIVTEHVGRKRLTGGVKLSSIYKRSSIDLHLNYQQYFYKDSKEISASDNNRLTAMLVLHF